MKTHVLRVYPNQDLLEEIDAFVQKKGIKAGCILTCVGNMKKTTLQMADERVTNVYRGSWDIISLVGTLTPGNSHLHMCISDKNGFCIGGHLKNDSIVYLSAEIVIGELEDVTFKRKFDQNTGYEELLVEKSL